MVLEGARESIEAFYVAMDMEREGFRFFMDLSRKAKDPHCRSMFLSLAEWERDHIERLDRYVEALRKEEKLPSPGPSQEARALREKLEGIFNTIKAEGFKQESPDMDQVEALKIGLEMEGRFAAFYKKGLEEAEDPVIRKFYESLLREERAHHQVLENTILYLERPIDWFAKEERPHFDGG